MKRIISLLAVSIIFCAVQAYAHHPAADIVDEDIYAVIDEMVSDTPHADLVFDDMGGTTTTTTITGTLLAVESLVDDVLLYEASLLAGDVYMTIEFTEGGNTELTIVQTR